MNIIKEEKSKQNKAIWFKNKSNKFVKYEFNYSKNYDELVRYFKNPVKNENLKAKVLKTLNYINTQILKNTRDDVDNNEAKVKKAKENSEDTKTGNENISMFRDINYLFTKGVEGWVDKGDEDYEKSKKKYNK
jgi:hypothetical protein